MTYRRGLSVLAAILGGIGCVFACSTDPAPADFAAPDSAVDVALIDASVDTTPDVVDEEPPCPLYGQYDTSGHCHCVPGDFDCHGRCYSTREIVPDGCGPCSTRCSEGQFCTHQSSPEHRECVPTCGDGGSGVMCPIDGGSACLEMNDPAHCGACDVACTAGTHCATAVGAARCVPD